MKPSEKSKHSTRTAAYLDSIQRMHPYLTLNYVGLGVLAILLLFILTVNEIYKPNKEIEIPLAFFKPFILSTVVLGFSGYLLSGLSRLHSDEKIGQLKDRMLNILLVASAYSFLLIYQIIYVSEQDLVPLYNYKIQSILMLSIMHGIVFMGAFAYSFYLYWELASITKDPIKVLMWETSPFQRTKLRLLNVNWKFMIAFWVACFIYIMFVL